MAFKFARPLVMVTIVATNLVAAVSARAARTCSDIFERAPETVTARSSRKAPRPPPFGEDAIQIRAQQAWKGGLREKVRLLNTVHSELYWEFPGMEPQIDQVMANIKQRVLYRDLVKGGGVDSLVGFSGYAKSDMMNRLCALTGARCVMIKIQQGQVDVSQELLQSLADVPEDGKQVPLAILVFDEWQNFKNAGDLSEAAPPVSAAGLTTSNPEGVSTTVINEKVKRQQFVRMLVDMYGTGEMKVEPDRTGENYADGVGSYVHRRNSYLEEHSGAFERAAAAKKALAEAKPEEEKADLQLNVRNAESHLSNISRSIQKNDNDMVEWINGMLRNYGPILSRYRGMTPRNVAEMFKANLEAETDYIKEMTKGTPYQKTLTFKQLVTVITANPEKTIKNFNRQIDGKITDPDAIREAAAKIPVEDIRKELFEDKFEGDAAIAGLRRRLGIDNMRMILPFGKAQLHQLVSRQIEKIQMAFGRRISEAGLDGITLKIDDSVKNLLITEGFVANSGPGMYFGREKILIGNFLSDVTDYIIDATDDVITRSLEVPNAARPEVLTWSFNSAREFVITGTTKGKTVYEERTTVRRIEDQNVKTEMDIYEVRKSLAAKAGEIVAGMALFGSLPMNTHIDSAVPERWSLSSLWSPPSKQRFGRSEDFIRVALGSVAAKNLLSDGFDSTLSDPALKFAHETLLSMVAQLRQREERYEYLMTRGEDGRKIYEREFPVPLGISPEVFKALMDAADADPSAIATGSAEVNNSEEILKRKATQNAALNRALRYLHRDTEKIISQNTELLSEMMQLMEKKLALYRDGKAATAELTSAEILTLVERNYQYCKRTQKVKAWLYRALRIKARRSGDVILAEDVRRGDVGTISVKSHPLFGPDESLMKRKTWKKLWYWMTRRLEAQRPFRPL